MNIEKIIKYCVHKNILSANGYAYFIDYQQIKNNIKVISSLLPSKSFNALAIKTNPLFKIHEKLGNYKNTGREAASISEMFLAKEAGVENEHLVFNSPLKTLEDYEVLKNNFKGCYVNITNVQEFDIAKKYKNDFHFAVRINPAINPGTAKHMFVSDDFSKFGVDINNPNLINLIAKNDFITGIHVHIGSMVQNLEIQISGIKKIVEIANRININSGSRKIKFINIGGGLPYDYRESRSIDIRGHFKKIKESCPELFNGTYNLITEYGRFVMADAGCFFSNVDYVKKNENRQMALIHIGADALLRECYIPEEWYHNVSLLDQNFTPKPETKSILTDIGGPLCFGGDYPTKNRLLPNINQNDKIIIHDCGANTIGLWSRHCSRKFPLCIMYEGEKVEIIKKQETEQEVVNFWK